jgi:NACHT domain
VTADVRDTFASRFAALLKDSALLAKQVVARVNANRPRDASWSLTAGVLSAWKTGRNLPSGANEDGFFRVVRVLTEHARGRAARGHAVGPLLDEVGWTRMLQQARAASLPDVALRDDIAVYLKALIDWMDTDPWPRDRWFGGPTLKPSVIERKLQAAVISGMHEQFDADWLVEKCQRLVVLGGPGSGKTWLAKRTARRCAEKALQILGAGGHLDEIELPLFTTCARLLNADGDIRHAAVYSAFDQLADLGGSRRSAVLREVFAERNASILLIIDSLDEAPGSDERLRQADTLPWRIVLTSRLSSWNNQFDMQKDSGSHQIGELQPLRYPEDVEPCIHGWFAHRPAAGSILTDQIARQPGLQHAATVPLILAFYCIIGSDDPLPEFRRDIYDRVLKRILTGRWHGNSGHVPDVTNCMKTLRDWAWTGARVHPVSEVGTWVDEIPTEPAQLDRSDIQALDHIATPIGPADIDTDQIQRRFIHRSIREHLVAEYVARLPVDEAAEKLFSHLWYDPDWEYSAPAAIAMHPERDHLLETLIGRASGSSQLPEDLSHFDVTWEFRGLLARVAVESSEADWSPELVAVIGKARVELGASNRMALIGRTAHWESSNGQLREALVKFLVRGLVTHELLGCLVELRPSLHDKRQVREALLTLLASDSDGMFADQMSMWISGSVQLALTADDKRKTLGGLLGLLADNPGPWRAAFLAGGIRQLNPTAEDKRQIRDILFRILANETESWNAALLVGSVVRFVLTAKDRRHARKALLGFLVNRKTEDDDYAVVALAGGLAKLDPTAEDQRQAREVLLGLLVRATDINRVEELAIRISELNPTTEDQRQVHDILLHWLGRDPDDWDDFDAVERLKSAMVELTRTAEDKHKLFAAALETLGTSGSPWTVSKMTDCAIQFAATAEDKCQARQTLIGMLAHEPDNEVAVELVGGIIKLAATAEDKRQARQTLLKVLAAETNGWSFAQLVDWLLELNPTAEDKHQVREALLALLPGQSNGWPARQLASRMIKLDQQRGRNAKSARRCFA